MKNLLIIFLMLIVSGCAVNTVQEKSVEDVKEKEKIEVETEIKLVKIDEVKVEITTKSDKNCSILLNKRVIELNKLVDKEFTKVIKLKENENINDVIVECN